MSVGEGILKEFLASTASVIGIASLHLETSAHVKSHLMNIYTNKQSDAALKLLPLLNQIINYFQNGNGRLHIYLSKLDEICGGSRTLDGVEDPVPVVNDWQEDDISTEALISEVIKAVKTDHSNFPGTGIRKRACRQLGSYLRRQNDPVVADYLRELKTRIKLTDLRVGFKEYVQMIWTDLTDEQGPLPNYFERKQKQKYSDNIRKAVKVVQELISAGHLDSISNDEFGREDVFVHLLVFLNFKETEWKQSGQKGIPPDHREIIRLGQDDGNQGLLIAYVRHLLGQARSSNCIARLEQNMRNGIGTEGKKSDSSRESAYPKEEDSGGFSLLSLLGDKSVKLAAFFGSTFKFGLELLTKVVKNDNLLRVVVWLDDVIGAILSSHPYLVSAGVSAIYITGVCIWNAWRCWRDGRSVKRALKNVVDAAVTTVLANVMAFGIAGLVVPFAAPIGLCLFITASIRIGASVILQPIIKRITQWFFNLAEDEMLEQSYNKLQVNKNARDEEIRSSYRRLVRKYHEDKLTQRGATKQEIQQGNEKIYELQRALGYISVARQKMAESGGAGEENDISFLERVKRIVKKLRKMFKNRKNRAEEEETIRALMGIQYN